MTAIRNLNYGELASHKSSWGLQARLWIMKSTRCSATGADSRSKKALPDDCYRFAENLLSRDTKGVDKSQKGALKMFSWLQAWLLAGPASNRLVRPEML